ncbi:MAG: hypothetical protein KC417_10580, partial [Myxococcales bacterium]|nr:hypothetical protein [Myxococcales bacterium]
MSPTGGRLRGRSDAFGGGDDGDRCGSANGGSDFARSSATPPGTPYTVRGGPCAAVGDTSVVAPSAI